MPPSSTLNDSAALQPNPIFVSSLSTAATNSIQADDDVARLLASIVELQCRLDESTGLIDGAGIAANTLQQHLRAARVLVAWRYSDRAGCEIIADTDRNAEDDRTDQRLAAGACEEIAMRATLTCWPPPNETTRHALLAVSNFVKAESAHRIDGCSLDASHGVGVGAIVVLDAVESPDTVARFIDAIRIPVAGKLAALQRLEPSGIEKRIRSLRSIIMAGRLRTVGIVTMVLAAVMCVPTPYRVTTNCELQPVSRRYVAAPFDGPLQQAIVRSGDVVIQGQLLARMNAREIEYELSGVRADLHRALQQTKGHVAEHEFAETKMARLDAQRLESQADLLEYRRGRVDVCSPIDGVVASGDLQQSEGTPLSKGDTLFEIAPLGKMIVEIAIPEAEFAYVRPGMPVRVTLDALPNQPLRGTLNRIHPKAELVEESNVFVAEMEVDDPNNTLRPGMRGRVTVTSDRYSLGWCLFHRPYYAACKAVRW